MHAAGLFRPGMAVARATLPFGEDWGRQRIRHYEDEGGIVVCALAPFPIAMVGFQSLCYATCFAHAKGQSCYTLSDVESNVLNLYLIIALCIPS